MGGMWGMWECGEGKGREGKLRLECKMEKKLNKKIPSLVKAPPPIVPESGYLLFYTPPNGFLLLSWLLQLLQVIYSNLKIWGYVSQIREHIMLVFLGVSYLSITFSSSIFTAD